MAQHLDHLQNQGSFEPAEIEEMSAAFSGICKLLGVSQNDTEVMDAIASQVVSLARKGTSSAAGLPERFPAENNAAAFYAAVARNNLRRNDRMDAS